MAKKLKPLSTESLRRIAHDRAALPEGEIRLKYESDADTLWVRLAEHPQITRTDDRRLESDGVLYHYRGRKLVAVEILDAAAGAQRQQKVA